MKKEHLSLSEADKHYLEELLNGANFVFIYFALLMSLIQLFVLMNILVF